MKKIILTFLWFCLLRNVFAQVDGNNIPLTNYAATDSAAIAQILPEKKQSDTGRKWLAGALALGGMSSSLLLLTKSNNYRYNKNFNTLNDGRAWLQMDKNEHLFLSYTTTRYLTGLNKWAGYTPPVAVLLGSAGSLLYLTTKEFLDGHHTNWGWSWMDMGANIFGTGLFAGQELVWQEQKIQLKFSALPKRYERSLDARAEDLFGRRIPERILKDYNAQTYWLSFNLTAVTASQKIPAWLNLAVGYGAENLYGPYDNIGYANGIITFNRNDLKRYRQWYLSPDIDLTKIKTNSRTVKTILFALNAVKVPLPALAISNQKFKGYWLHF